MAEACTGSGFVTTSGNCPDPHITSVSPNRGPPQGGTTIVIQGSNLGVSLTDIINIAVGTTACDVIESTYIPGQKITCVIRTSNSDKEQDANVTVTIFREGGSPQTAKANYKFLNPVVESVFPPFGPVSGGTKIRVSGRNLGIGNPARTSVHFIRSGNSTVLSKRQVDSLAGNCSVT